MNIIQVAAVLLCLHFGAAFPFQTGEAPKTLQKIGPEAGWQPGMQTMQIIREKCGSGTNFGECFVTMMQKSGASPQAIAFTRLTENTGYMRDFRDAGRVDVAYVNYPFRANENQGCLLVNGDHRVIDVDGLDALPKDEMQKNQQYAALAKKYPNILIFPGDRTGTDSPAMERLSGGGQRFIVTYRLLNGCHACELVGSAMVAFDFDGGGRFSGKKFLAIEKASGDDIKTDKGGKRGGAKELIGAVIKEVAFAQDPASKPQLLHAFQQASPPAADLSPDSLDFSDQVVKKSSPPERITVTNVGGKQLYINSASITGDNWKDFTISKDTCTGATIAPNKSCIVDVKFTPMDTGDRSATLVLKNSALDSPQQVSLTGSGINSIDVPPF